MVDAMLDARQEGGSYRRIEVITGQRRRRRWTAQEKARIVAESFEEGANISEVARRNGVVRGLLTVWRHKLAAAAGVNAAYPARAARRSDCGGWPKARMKARRIRSGSRKPVDCATRSIASLEDCTRCRAASILGRTTAFDGVVRRLIRPHSKENGIPFLSGP